MTIAETILRDELAERMRNAMVGVLEETGYPIPAARFASWRATQRVRGTIPGMPCTVECVATDGNLGLFVPQADAGHGLGTAFLGHVHRFEWLSHEGEDGPVYKVGAPGPLYSLSLGDGAKPKAKGRTRPRSLRQQILDDL